MSLITVTGILLNASLALGALYKKSVTPLASAAGFIVGMGLYQVGGVFLWVSLTFFFLSSTIIGRIKSASRKEIAKIQHKTGKRDWIQVLANTLPALFSACFYFFTDETLWLTAAFAAFAAANADTWASEIGVLSSKKPVSILTGKPVPAGISGGITILGTISSAGGALMIAAISMFAGSIYLAQAFIVLICGFFGSVVDSVLGAALQAKYKDSEYGFLTERPEGNTIVAGLAWMNNDMVNLLSITSAGSAALVFQLVLF